ncbi:MAG TPA: hypothetical protein VF658_13060 [Pyrinomonadaceae bacterium]
MKHLKASKICALGCGLLMLLSFVGCSTTTTEYGSKTTETTTVNKSADPKSTADAPSKFSGDNSGAQDLVNQFVQPNADHAALTRQLKPTKEDYRAIFATEEMAAKAESTYAEVWNSPDAVIKPKPGQTSYKVTSVSTDNIKNGVGLDAFPGGYKDAGALFKPGLDLYKFDFLAPGEERGMAYDALVYVNGHWRFIPKPWRLAK